MDQDETGQGQQKDRCHGIDPFHRDVFCTQRIQSLVDGAVQPPVAFQTPGLGTRVSGPAVTADHEKVTSALLATLRTRRIRVSAFCTDHRLGRDWGVAVRMLRRTRGSPLRSRRLVVATLMMGFAVQSASTGGAVHQHPGIALLALRAVDMKPLATSLATLEIDRVQVLALAAQSSLAHRA